MSATPARPEPRVSATRARRGLLAISGAARLRRGAAGGAAAAERGRRPASQRPCAPNSSIRGQGGRRRTGRAGAIGHRYCRGGGRACRGCGAQGRGPQVRRRSQARRRCPAPSVRRGPVVGTHGHRRRKAAFAAAAGGAAAGAGAASASTKTLPAPRPSTTDGGGPNRTLVIAGVVGAVLLVMLLVFALPKDDGEGGDSEAIETGSQVIARRAGRHHHDRAADHDDRAADDDDRAADDDEPSPGHHAGACDRRAPTTASTADGAANDAASGTRPAHRDVPPRFRGRMLLTEGGVSAVIIINVGGQPGAYAVTTQGEVSVLGTGAAPSALARSSRYMAAEDASAEIPQGTITVSGDDGEIVTIPVVIT